jgi:hypothetical protein
VKKICEAIANTQCVWFEAHVAVQEISPVVTRAHEAGGNRAVEAERLLVELPIRRWIHCAQCCIVAARGAIDDNDDFDRLIDAGQRPRQSCERFSEQVRRAALRHDDAQARVPACRWR